jgi:HK97 family phage major capsid protein
LTFGQVAGTPKTVGAYFEISDRLLKQMTPAGEAFVLTEAGKAVAAAVDVALINGSGSSGQPTGILGTSGIGSESGGTLTWATTVSAINDVEVANALVNEASAGWAIAPDSAEIMRAREGDWIGLYS